MILVARVREITRAMRACETKPVALLTPTYGPHLELCALLCESVDRHVTSFSKHYLLVPDNDLALFSRFAGERRVVIPASAFLPTWLKPLPRIFRRKRRQFWWSLRAKPASGWHVQQILKIAATNALPHQRFCILDSDIVFFRDFDLARFELPNAIPLFQVNDEVTAEQPPHARWVETSHQLLGLPTPSLPAPDFIGHIICWDQSTTREMAARIEAVTGRGWIEALCRTRDFSEYMLYGYFVQNNAKAASRHRPAFSTPCVSYWDRPRLDRSGLDQLLLRARSGDVAFSVTSFSGTPVESIRAAIASNEMLRTSLAPVDEQPGLAALC
jgi:Family of unknown function (DUF6492)